MDVKDGVALRGNAEGIVGQRYDEQILNVRRAGKTNEYEISCQVMGTMINSDLAEAKLFNEFFESFLARLSQEGDCLSLGQKSISAASGIRFRFELTWRYTRDAEAKSLQK